MNDNIDTTTRMRRDQLIETKFTAMDRLFLLILASEVDLRGA